MSEKQFPPSAKRISKLRKEGKIIKTQWVTTAVSYWVAVLFLPLSLAWVRDGSLLQWSGYQGWEPGVALQEALAAGFRAVVLLVAALAIGAVAAEVAQSRGLFVPSLILQGFHRYRPGAYLSRVKQGLIDGALGVARCSVFFVVVAPVFHSLAYHAGLLLALEGEQSFGAIRMFLRALAVRSGCVLIAFAAVAYGFAKWRFLRENRMSLHDVREEWKEGEGDPHVKAARKHEHRAMIMSELERRVRRSKVIVVKRAPAST